MKTYFSFLLKKNRILILFLIISKTLVTSSFAQVQDQQILKYKQITGRILDSDTGNVLVSASLLIKDSNISTITNLEGEFILKIPENLLDGNVHISMLGYKNTILQISNLKENNNTIYLKAAIIKLDEVVVKMSKDAKKLVQSVFKNRKNNYLDKHVTMTAFYRESIKKRTKNVSLAEAIVKIYKQPYNSNRKDKIKLYKSRKSTDYSRLDTIAFKLQGGPFNALYVDVMKYPEYIFYPDAFNQYQFTFSTPTIINGKSVLVVDFKQNQKIDKPLYYGKLYIDMKTNALVSARYSLNVTDKIKSAKLFVKRKPKDVFAYPTNVDYRVDYRQKEEKWYYVYGNSQLTFKIKKKGKWFKTKYVINSEMAVTDWQENPTKESPSHKKRMRHSIIIGDEASGFSDPEYWGAFNLIEPDKSIESAIKKIKRELIE